MFFASHQYLFGFFLKFGFQLNRFRQLNKILSYWNRINVFFYYTTDIHDWSWAKKYLCKSRGSIIKFKYKAFYWLTGTETKFAGSSCNDLVTSDGAGSTIISGHYDKRIRFWDIRTEMSANHIMLQGKVTSLDLSRGKFISNLLNLCFWRVNY